MWFHAESTTNDNESIETTQDHGTVDVSVDVGDDNDLGDTGNSEPVACDCSVCFAWS